MLAIIIMSVLLNCQYLDSLLVPFPQIPGNYLNRTEHYIEIRKYDLILKVDTLLYNNKIIAKPDSGYYSNIYEMFKEKYIIVIPTTEDTKYLSTIYELPKNEIKIIALNDLDKVYEVNLEGMQLVDIDLKKGLVYAKNRDTDKTFELKIKRIK